MSTPMDGFGQWSGLMLAQTQGSAPESALIMGAPGAGAAPATGTTAAPTAAGGAGAPPAGGGGFSFGVLLLPIALLVILMLMTGGAQKRERKRLAAMLAGLKKNDKVLTIGGMIGTVIDVRPDEIILKIDENSNSRVRFTRNAIQQVLKSAEGPAPSPMGEQPQIEVRAGKGERAAV